MIEKKEKLGQKRIENENHQANFKKHFAKF